MKTNAITGLCALALFVSAAPSALAQPPAAPAAPQGRGQSPAATVVSPDVAADRQVTFRIYAPNAQAIRLGAGDIPGVGQNTQLTKGENGIWQVLWFATGKDDGLITTTQATVDMLKKHGFSPVFKETPGGHTWINWRNYLNEFVPQLFQ